jgi:hypothetical protein
MLESLTIAFNIGHADLESPSLGAMYLGHLPWWPGTPAGTTRPGLRLGRMKFRIARPRSHSMTNRSVKTFWSLGAIAIVSWHEGEWMGQESSSVELGGVEKTIPVGRRESFVRRINKNVSFLQTRREIREVEELTRPSTFAKSRDEAVCFVGLQIGNSTRRLITRLQYVV